MDNTLRDLLLNGFMVYPKKDKFIVKKEAVESNMTVLKETEFDNYDSAIEFALSKINKPNLFNWIVIVRYNRGLGIEYKNLLDIQAYTLEEAKRIALEDACKIIDESMILEIKVRIKN